MGRMLTVKALRRPDEIRIPRPTDVTATPVVAPASDPVFQPASADAQKANPARKIAFYAGLAFLFVRLGVIPEIIFSLTNTNTPILYLVGVPAILGAMLIGGLQRTIRYRTALLWLIFFGWMALAVPFSSWTGGSWMRISDYGRYELPLLFVVGGLAASWNDVRAICYTIAAAAVFNLLSARFFGEMSNGRIDLADMSGTLGNPNDLASQLLLVMPFLLFVVFERRNSIVRAILLAATAYAIYLILATASRGGLVALSIGYLVFVFGASRAQRVAGVAAGVVVAIAIPLFLPAITVTRLATVFGESGKEAQESSADRSYLFQQSIRYTLEHPLFGVGPDQFSNFEGKESRSKGWHGLWHATHCAYTQVSSECGIPALIFFAGAIISALALVFRLYRAARRKGCQDIANVCFCYLMAMSGFLTALAFLSNAYTFHLPAMLGLAISISYVGTRELARRQPKLAGDKNRVSVPLAKFA